MLAQSTIQKYPKCPKCGSIHRIDVLCDSAKPHYAKQVCANCGRWFAWLKNPDTQKKRLELREKLEKLLDERGDDITRWEWHFVYDIYEQLETKSLSPRQQERLDSIIEGLDDQD